MRALEVETLTKFRGKIGKNDKLLYDDIKKKTKNKKNKTKTKETHTRIHMPFLFWVNKDNKNKPSGSSYRPFH